MARPVLSPFPFDQLPRRSRADVVIESALARWAVATSELPSVAALVGGPVRVTTFGISARDFDPYAAFAEIRAGTLAVVAAASGLAIRTLAQRVLGGPAELPAPRPATIAEHAIWSLLLAAALDDLAVAGDVWPLADTSRAAIERDLVDRAKPTRELDPGDRKTAQRPAIKLAELEAARVAIGGREVAPIELVLDVAGVVTTVVVWCPVEIVLRVPPTRPRHDWAVDLPIVIARCAIQRAAVAALAVRDVIVVERELSLAIGDGSVALDAAPGAVEATVATGYVRGDMGLPEAELELQVRLGTTKLGLRRLGELAVGEVIALGRPLSGPYEIHVGNRKIGEGELVDIDGEVGVRIVSLIEE